VAQALAGRDEDLVGLVALLVFNRVELFEARQTRLALGAAALGVAAHPLQLFGQRLLAGLLTGFFLLQPLAFLLQPRGVVALPRNPAATVELEDPLGRVFEEVAVMGRPRRCRCSAPGTAPTIRRTRRPDGWSVRPAAACPASAAAAGTAPRGASHRRKACRR